MDNNPNDYEYTRPYSSRHASAGRSRMQSKPDGSRYPEPLRASSGTQRCSNNPDIRRSNYPAESRRNASGATRRESNGYYPPYRGSRIASSDYAGINDDYSAGRRENRRTRTQRGGSPQLSDSAYSRSCTPRYNENASRTSSNPRNPYPGSPSARQASGGAYRNDRKRTSSAPHARKSRESERSSVHSRFEKIDQNLGNAISARIILTVLLALLLVAAVSVVGRSFFSNQQSQGTFVADTAKKIATISDSSKLSETEVIKLLEDIGVESEWAEKAALLSQTDARFQAIAENSDGIGKEGPEVANKLVKLAVSDPEAVDYVASFADSYPKKEGEKYTETVKKGTVPVLYQWDKRWGYLKYSSTALGCTGCGPTTMSMVYMGLTGENDKTPADMAKFAAENGYETEYEGTLNAFFEGAAESFGLQYEELDVNSSALLEALDGGQVIICNVSTGDFTDYGHFIVITGVDDNGDLKINDPYSSVNSSKTWDVDQVIDQTVALYAFK